MEWDGIQAMWSCLGLPNADDESWLDFENIFMFVLGNFMHPLDLP